MEKANYWILENKTVDGLTSQVNSLMEEGFEPVGGVCSDSFVLEGGDGMVDNAHCYYYQAMLYREDK